jgi:hypothetical protein
MEVLQTAGEHDGTALISGVTRLSAAAAVGLWIQEVPPDMTAVWPQQHIQMMKTVVQNQKVH